MKYLRHEAEYDVSVSLTNEQRTFRESKTVKFVPSKCSWYLGESGDASNSYKVFGSPGVEDIKFTLERRSNPELDCSSFNFFNEVDSLDFAFILLDTNEFIDHVPEVSYAVTPDGKVTITLTSSQQVKLPLFRDIQVVITMHWKNSNFKA